MSARRSVLLGSWASLFFGSNSKVYHCSVRFGTGSDGGLWVRRSDDNGNSWPAANEFLKNTGVGTSTVFACGRGMADPTDATGMSFAYACRFNNNSTIGVCLFTSTDGGQNMTFTQNLDGAVANVNYPGARYYPTGEMLVYWTTNASQSLQGKTSCDNGLSWSPMEVLAAGNALPAYVVDAPGTADFGALYQPSGSGAEIFFKRF